MRHVQIAAHDNRFLSVELHEIAAETVLPYHAVIKPSQSVLRVWRVDGNKIEVGHLQSYHASFVVVFVLANAIAHIQRLMLREDGRTAISFLLGIVPVGLITDELDVELPLLHLCLLQAEEIGIEFAEHFLESLSHASAQAVDIPRN